MLSYVRMPCGLLADQDVADPDRVGVLALERALVLDVALGARRRVVDEQAVLDVLTGIGEVDAEHLDAAAGAEVVRRGAGAHDVAAERDRDVAELGVTADPGVLRDDVDAVVVPVLDRHEGQLGAVLEDDLDVLGPRGRAVVVDDDDGLGELAGAYEQVPCSRLLEALAVQPDRGGLVDHRVGRDRHLEDRLGGFPGAGRHAVDGHVARDAASGVGCGHGDCGDAFSSVDLDLEVVAVERGVLVEAAEALERGESPDLLEARRDRVVLDVEGPLGVQVRLDRGELECCQRRFAWRSTDSPFHLEFDQAVELEGVLHRQLARDGLDEAADDHRHGLVLLHAS